MMALAKAPVQFPSSGNVFTGKFQGLEELAGFFSDSDLVFTNVRSSPVG